MISIELLTRDNFENYIDGIMKLFRMCFTAPVKQEDFIWRYLNSPYEDVNAIVALDEEKVVGFLGTMPNQVKNGENLVKAAMYTNLMTNSDYCGQGIFTQMAMIMEKTLSLKGYEFIYSFPNYQSHPILINKCNWKDIYEIPRLEKNTDSFCKVNSEVLNGNILKDNEFALDYSQINHLISQKGFIRTADYIMWRIKSNPVAEYDNFVFHSNGIVMAYIIVRKYYDEYNIVDISFNSKKQAEALLAKAIEQFNENEYRILTAWCPTNTELHSIYEKNGFTNKYPITYFAGKCIGEKWKNNELENWHGWFVHAIDDNIY